MTHIEPPTVSSIFASLSCCQGGIFFSNYAKATILWHIASWSRDILGVSIHYKANELVHFITTKQAQYKCRNWQSAPICHIFTGRRDRELLRHCEGTDYNFETSSYNYFITYWSVVTSPSRFSWPENTLLAGLVMQRQWLFYVNEFNPAEW